MANALEINNLKKIYGSGVEALRGIDLSVKEGDFYALLGPNGAGKSTTIGIITSLVNKTSGKVNVFGYDLEKDLVRAKQQIGFLLDGRVVILLPGPGQLPYMAQLFCLWPGDLSPFPVRQQQSLLPMVHANDTEHAALVPSGGRLDDLARVIKHRLHPR